jgi:hypothetical protein
MTPYDKAKELFSKVYPYVNDYSDPETAAKELALIVCDEVLGQLVSSTTDYGASILAWEQVKKEVKNI